MLNVAIVQFRPAKGAYRENLARLGQIFREATALDPVPDLLILPESALTGYFLEGGVAELALSAAELLADLAERHSASGAPPIDVAIGFYEVWRNRLYNSALYCTLGGPDAGIRHVHRKVFLPTYGVFDEDRFVEAGSSVTAFDTAWGRAAMMICEDAWHSIMPTLAALDGAQVLIVPSATPARGLQPENNARHPANLERWDRLAQTTSEEHGVYVAMAQLVGFEGGKAFAGGSIVADPSGEIIARGPVFDEALVRVPLDFDEITRARADAPLLADLEIKWPHLMASASMAGDTAARKSPPRAPTGVRTGRGARDNGRDPLAIDPELTRRWLVEFLRDEIHRHRGFDKAVVGLSGGVDSSLVAFLAAEALGPENVIGVRMPYRTSSDESLQHAQLVADQLGVEVRTVDISGGVDSLVSAIGGDTTPTRRGNIMARMRMITLFDLSAALTALPVGTGNKTERLFGYFTWHADDSPPVNPIGDLFKSQVWQLARHMEVPDAIVDKPASADLIQGQTDESDLGISYAKADAILHHLLSGYRSENIVELGFSAGEVELVQGRLESTHWKRRLPTVAMVSRTAIGEYYLRPVDY
jgi:NAD+ synthase (glutamine-hydrolysing)